MQTFYFILIIAVLFISISSSNRVRKSVKKRIDKNEVQKALKELEEAGR